MFCGGRHFYSGQSPLYEASSCLGVESVHERLFFLQRRPPNVHVRRSAFFPAREAVTLHLESVCGCYCGPSRCSGRPVLGKARSHEPLDSVELKFLLAKTELLTVLTSIKRLGDLQAFSVGEECLVFGPAYSHVVLRPWPGYVPKVSTKPFHILGRWEGCDLLHGMCMSRACLSPSTCHKVVTGFRLWRFP